MAFRDYIAEEVAEECAAGLLSRREALRRLSLLGISLAAGTTLLAACGDDDDTEAGGTTSSSAGATTSAAAGGTTDGELIRFAGPKGELIASFAEASDAKGGVLIVHENRGLTPHFVSLPGRLAGDGYTAMCVDLLSSQGGTAAVGDEGAASAALGSADAADLVADLRAGIGELARRASGVKVGAMGFCFGGGMVWQLLQEGEDRLAAAVPFYGPAPDAPDFSRAKAAVLAIYAGNDARVNASRDRAAAALESAGLVHEVRTFPDVDHAFFNDTGQRYNEAAATEAYAAVLAWFTQHLA
jgi:carboxymethylenebutenolidase